MLMPKRLTAKVLDSPLSLLITADPRTAQCPLPLNRVRLPANVMPARSSVMPLGNSRSLNSSSLPCFNQSPAAAPPAPLSTKMIYPFLLNNTATKLFSRIALTLAISKSPFRLLTAPINFMSLRQLMTLGTTNAEMIARIPITTSISKMVKPLWFCLFANVQCPAQKKPGYPFPGQPGYLVVS